MAQAKDWPYTSLTQAPTNLKEAIDWVLRVTGRDGKKNAVASPPQFGCLCYLAKAVKDLLYDAKDPGTPGPSPQRYWDGILLTEEQSIVKPVLQDLGLQKLVGWQEGDECCLKGAEGIGKKCECRGGVGGTCCNSAGGSGCTCNTPGDKNCCYRSAYKRPENASSSSSSSGSSTGELFLWTSISSDSTKVHLLARIFLGSVCLIWSGLSQLGFLTGKDGERWSKSSLHEIKDGDTSGLGSFMAAMGYDLDRLNQGTGSGKNGGEFVQKLLNGEHPNGKDGIKWQEFKNGTASSGSVAEYYSSIYGAAQSAVEKDDKTEKICEQYPLLVLHILASGYFRAGSAGAKGIIPAPKAPSSDPKTSTPDSTKKDNTPRKPRTIREILYWLSALPYSQGYKALVERMKGKYPKKETNPQETVDQIDLHGEGAASTTLKRDCVTHYLLAACGYCPLVLIGIQGTIATSGSDSAPATGPGSGDDNKCKKKYDEKTPNDGCSKCPSEGRVCYRGYHLEVSKFGPLHGMYANGLFGFHMEVSAAQCLDQMRVYVYHCFYQLYFLRKQCKVGVVKGGTTVLGWQSCRYGYQVSTKKTNDKKWMCEADGQKNGDHAKNCGLKNRAGSTSDSPLQSFLCDAMNGLWCQQTVGKGVEEYPSIEAHMNKTVDSDGKEHEPHKKYPELCPVPMGWQAETSNSGAQKKENHFKDLKDTHKQAELDPATGQGTYPAHCTGRTLSLLLEYYCDPGKCHGTLVVLLRLLACITPTVPRTLGDLFGFYYYIVYIGGNKGVGAGQGVYDKLKSELGDVRLGMSSSSHLYSVVGALQWWNKDGACQPGSHSDVKAGSLKTLYGCTNNSNTDNKCCPYLSPLSGQQYGQLSPLMAGTYLSWLVYLIGEFHDGLEGLEKAFKDIKCKDSCGTGNTGNGCGNGQCQAGSHGNPCGTGSSNGGVCKCDSVVSCTGVLPVLYKYGFGYGDVESIGSASWSLGPDKRKCHKFLEQLEAVIKEESNSPLTNLTTSINQLIYTTRLPWIFVLTLAWLVAVLYLAFGAIWPLDWTHMRSHCRGWFRKGSLSPWEILMVGKKKGRGILEFFGKT